MADGLNEILQDVDGLVSKVMHEVDGYKATYTLIIDKTADPMTESTLTIFLGTTPTMREYDNTTGRRVSHTLDNFYISRENLKVSGTYYEPTLEDSFVAFGTTSPVYFVRKVEDTSHTAGEYLLSCTAEFNVSSRG